MCIAGIDCSASPSDVSTDRIPFDDDCVFCLAFGMPLHRRSLPHRILRLLMAFWVRSAYRFGKRVSAKRFAPIVARLERQLQDARAQLNDTNSQHARKWVQSATEHEEQVRELKRQIAVLNDTISIKDVRIEQQAEIITRDRERVVAELAEATRRVVELEHDPAAIARPVKEQIRPANTTHYQ